MLGFFWVALVSWIRTGELDNGYVFENLSHSSRRPNFMVVDKNTAISDIEVSLSLTCYIFVLSLSFVGLVHRCASQLSQTSFTIAWACCTASL